MIAEKFEMTHTQSETSVPTLNKDEPTCLSMTTVFILENIISYSNLGPGTRFLLRTTVRHTVFALKCFRKHMLLEICSKFAPNIAQMLPKVRKVLKGAQKAK